MNILMNLYAVRRKSDGYYIAKNHGRFSDWTNKLKEARVYIKPGPARSWVTQYARRNPEFGILELVELCVTEVRSVVEDDRVKKVIDRKAKKKIEQDIRNAEWKKQFALRQIQEGRDALEKLGVTL
jgi:hypothetical protein